MLQGKLFCRCDDNAHPQLCVVDPKSLEVLSSCKMDGKYGLLQRYIKFDWSFLKFSTL